MVAMAQTWKKGHDDTVRLTAGRAPSLLPSGAHDRQSPRPIQSDLSHLPPVTVPLPAITAYYRSITVPLPACYRPVTACYRLLPLITAYYRPP